MLARLQRGKAEVKTDSTARSNSFFQFHDDERTMEAAGIVMVASGAREGDGEEEARRGKV